MAKPCPLQEGTPGCVPLPFLGTPISRLAFVAVAVAVEFVFEFVAAAFRRAPFDVAFECAAACAVVNNSRASSQLAFFPEWERQPTRNALDYRILPMI